MNKPPHRQGHLKNWLALIIFYLLVAPLVCLAQAPVRGLDYYVEHGDANSPLLKDYANQQQAGALDSQLIRAANKPQVLANGQIIVDPIINGYGYDEAITNGGTYAAMIWITQPLFNKKILQPQFESLRLQNASIGNTAALSKIDLERAITRQYLDAFASYNQYQSNEAVYKLYQDQQRILEDLTRQGLYKQTDYLSFLVALQSQETTLGQLQLQYQTGLATLNYVCGIPDTAEVMLSEPSIEPNIPVDPEQSPFFRQFVLDSLSILNARAQVDTKYRPSLNWFANSGLNSSNLQTAYRNFGAEAGLNFNLPIYDGKQRQLQYRKLALSENTREQYAGFFATQYGQQVSMLVRQLKSSDDLIAGIRSRLANTSLLVDLDRKLLNTGDVRITDYILAINSYLTIENDLNQAEVDRWQIINQLNYWHH